MNEVEAAQLLARVHWRKLPADQYPLEDNPRRRLVRTGQLGGKFYPKEMNYFCDTLLTTLLVVVMQGQKKPKSREVHLFDDALVVVNGKAVVTLLEMKNTTIETRSLG